MHRLGGRNEDGLAHMVVMKTFRGWHCPHCSYISPSQKGNLKVHILNRHANPGESFACMFCGKHLSSRSSLQVHISQVHREQQKAKRMLEERLKITTLEERLKTEMGAGGEMGHSMGTAEALRQAMQHEDRMRAQHELGGMMGGQSLAKHDLGSLMGGQNMARILSMGADAGFDSGPASSSGSVPHSPRPPQPVGEGSPGYSPGSLQPQPAEEPAGQPPVEAHYHKDSEAVPMFSKEMADTPSLVYHKSVGGHSVSIYPKDLGPVGQAAAEVSSYPAPAQHYAASPQAGPAGYSSVQAGHHHSMGQEPHAPTTLD